MQSGSKTHWTIGIHPWTPYVKLYWVFSLGILLGAYFTSGEIVRYWFEFIVGLLLVKLILLVLSTKRIMIHGNLHIVTQSLFKKEKFPIPTGIQTSWSYGGLDMDGYSATHYEPKGMMCDIYIWLELESKSGENQLFYEVIKMGTKFPNNHRYTFQKPSMDNAIQIYDVDKFIVFLKKA